MLQTSFLCWDRCCEINDIAQSALGTSRHAFIDFFPEDHFGGITPIQVKSLCTSEIAHKGCQLLLGHILFFTQGTDQFACFFCISSRIILSF